MCQHYIPGGLRGNPCRDICYVRYHLNVRNFVSSSVAGMRVPWKLLPSGCGPGESHNTAFAGIVVKCAGCTLIGCDV